VRLCSDILRRALVGKLFKKRESDNALVGTVLSQGGAQTHTYQYLGVARRRSTSLLFN
jgi:hypothetical protein